MQLHCFFSCGVLPHHYAYRVVYIRFIGTHAHYDKICRTHYFIAERKAMNIKPIKTNADYQAVITAMPASD